MGRGKSSRPMVTGRHGRYRFQTGIVTADLLQRGIPMELALQLSRQLRREIESRDEITTDELEARLERIVCETPLQARSTTPLIISREGTFPFSRGILLRSLLTAGLEIEPAMEMGSDILAWLQSLTTSEIDEDHIEEEVARRLRTDFSPAHARRFRLSGWLRRQKRPVIILIGGSTGSGKSTLAAELAYRLGIRSVTSTDMIRETMRAVLSPEVTPGLYDHSFTGMILGGRVLTNPRERVLAGFRQQAAQVTVGIRAVIRRTIQENNHIIIEGTHLIPPFSDYLPPGADALVAGLILAVPEEERHRARFPKRARKATLRSSDTYLEAFQSVRWIHDDLLSQAEESDSMVVANDRVGRTVSSVVGYLAEALPLERASPRQVHIEKTLFLILDGLADEPNPALDGHTPLSAATTPTLDCLAATGALGVVQTGSAPGLIPETDEGLQALLRRGLPSKPLKRGLLEALGMGIPLSPGAILLRGNLATRQPDGTLTDRRAGRIRAGVPELIRGLRSVQLSGGIRGHVFPAHEHRVVVMLAGSGLSDAVADTDPGSAAPIQHIHKARALDSTPEAHRTATALNELLAIARDHLESHPLNAEKIRHGEFPANCIITRGAASTEQLPEKDSAPLGALISGCGTALGVARAVGLLPTTSPKMTGNLDTDLTLKFETANKLLKKHGLVVIHIKGTDIAAHDRLPLQKRDFISAIDRALGVFLESWSGSDPPLRVVVSADHGTSSLTGNHLSEPVPLLVGSWEPSEERARFDEQAANSGALGLVGPGELAVILSLH
jgi:2,3-bisphosphoglycerate-independent phosphoglycerate mutase